MSARQAGRASEPTPEQKAAEQRRTERVAAKAARREQRAAQVEARAAVTTEG